MSAVGLTLAGAFVLGGLTLRWIRIAPNGCYPFIDPGFKHRVYPSVKSQKRLFVWTELGAMALYTLETFISFGLGYLADPPGKAWVIMLLFGGLASFLAHMQAAFFALQIETWTGELKGK